MVDDFIGAGGTLAAVRELISTLGCPSPDVIAVAGSDGELYRASLAETDQPVLLLPQPPAHLSPHWSQYAVAGASAQ